MCSLLFTALSYRDHGIEKQEKSFQVLWAIQKLWGNGLDLEHTWGFTVSANLHTPSMQKILFCFQIEWLKTGRAVRKCCQSHWLLWTEGYHGGIKSVSLLLASDCWVLDSSTPLFSWHARQTGSADSCEASTFLFCVLVFHTTVVFHQFCISCVKIMSIIYILMSACIRVQAWIYPFVQHNSNTIQNNNHVIDAN